MKKIPVALFALVVAFATASYATVKQPDSALKSKAADADLSSQLVGTWEGIDATTKEVVIETTYSADGSLTGWFINHEKANGSALDVKVSATAKWKIVDGKISVTDCATVPAERLPKAYASAEIVSIKGKELVLRSVDDGTKYLRTRKD